MKMECGCRARGLFELISVGEREWEVGNEW